MPSIALGKLLSGGSSKPTDNQNATGRKRRATRSGAAQLRQQHLPSPPIDPSSHREHGQASTNSYFGPLKKRGTGHSDQDFHEFDDYGLPVSDILPSPQIVRSSGSLDLERPTQKIKCRTCDKICLAVAAVSKCDHCYTINSSAAESNSSPPEPSANQLSVRKTLDVIDQTISEGLKKIEEKNLENTPVPPIPDDIPDFPTPPSQSNGWAPPDAPSRKSMLAPPKLAQHLGHRRGSAPDIARPSLPTYNSFPHDQQQSSGRRYHPGPISLPGNPHQRPEYGNRTSSFDPTSPKMPLTPDIRSTQRNVTYPSPRLNTDQFRSRMRTDLRDSYKPIFDLLADSICRRNLNVSFSTVRKHRPGRSSRESPSQVAAPETRELQNSNPMTRIAQMDHKDLMIGDVYDVASSLVGNQSFGKPPTTKHPPTAAEASGTKLVNQVSPHIDWKYLQRWYEAILSVGIPGKDVRLANLKGDNPSQPPVPSNARKLHVLEELGSIIRIAVLESIEQLLINQQIAPDEPQDIRYLLILLANPLLLDSKEYPMRRTRSKRSSTPPASYANSSRTERQHSPPRKVQKWLWNPSRQSRGLSLILGVLSNLSSDCHNYLTTWFSRYPEDVFQKHVDAILSFVNERLTLRRSSSGSPRKGTKNLTHNGIQTSQMFDDVLNSNVIPVLSEANTEDWQLIAACKVLQLFVRANDTFHPKSSYSGRNSGGVSLNSRRKPPTKQLIPTEHFYNSQLDSKDKFNLKEDFDAWEKKKPGFHLCQYPFLLTLGTKIKILEFDAKRRMASKARQEFFDAILRQGGSAEKFFHLNIRRTCIVEDSLQRVSEAISSSQEEAKKALKVRFEGEEGVDAGGLRKEWFLLLVRELFDPDVGLFLFNEESNFCYFNPHSLESSEQYQLVGAVLGLAIYNFTILDVPLPPFLFRKLAAVAPPTVGADVHQSWRPSWRPSVGDLAEYDPELARHLKQILEYDGNVAEDIGIHFEVDSLHYGKVQHHALIAGGDSRLVTNANREEYVELYIDHVLERSIRKQFEPFARGFYKACGGNALSLFRGEEIELLIRGSGELDFPVLRGSAVYENWKLSEADEEIQSGQEVEAIFPVVKWFWQLMAMSEPDDQRRVLRWITGSDRIPATGIGSLVIRVQCLGSDCERLPQARTCFNMLQLWNYSSRATFVKKFWYAVVESEGFGLK